MLSGGSHMINCFKIAKILAIREIQIQISVTCHYPPITMTKIVNDTSAEEDLENVYGSHCLWENSLKSYLFNLYFLRSLTLHFRFTSWMPLGIYLGNPAVSEDAH